MKNKINKFVGQNSAIKTIGMAIIILDLLNLLIFLSIIAQIILSNL